MNIQILSKWLNLCLLITSQWTETFNTYVLFHKKIRKWVEGKLHEALHFMVEVVSGMGGKDINFWWVHICLDKRQNL